MIAEKINTHLDDTFDYVDAAGDVRHSADFDPDDELIMIAKDPAFVVAARGMVRNARGPRRSRRTEVSGRDFGHYIDDAIAKETVAAGRDLTPEEIEKISRAAENALRRSH
ncbi:MAG: hypothetical protein WBP12_03760 [Candidatus Saccharimonas sp.]